MNIKVLENKSIYIIREAYAEFKNLASLWSMGKDSTALLWLIRKAFFGKIPFPIIHIDTGYKFPQMYKFRDKLAKEWGFNLQVARNEEAIKKGVSHDIGNLECCTQLKTDALKMFLDKYKFEGLFLAIRRDEHAIRAKERYFSPRDDDFKWDYKDQPLEMWEKFQRVLSGHLRIHPILHWREIDIWRYLKAEGIPVNPLYFARDGRRYRSLGCTTCTVPIESNAATIDDIIKELETTKRAEREGRSQDKEKTFMMQKLRALGYM